MSLTTKKSLKHKAATIFLKAKDYPQLTRFTKNYLAQEPTKLPNLSLTIGTLLGLVLKGKLSSEMKIMYQGLANTTL